MEESDLPDEMNELNREETTDNAPKVQPPAPVIRRNAWLKVLVTSSVFYVLLLVALLLTNNPNLFPTVVMVGNFMVPVAYVSFFYERRHLSLLTMSTVSLAFLYGGLVGVLAASLLEPFFLFPGCILAPI